MSQYLPTSPVPKIEDARVAILVAEWNSHINEAMLAQAKECLDAYGVEYEVFHVPGAIELTFGASQLIEASIFDAVIVFGTVIRGGTPHFDYVCQSVTQGITALNADCDIPVIFGVLTVDKEKDAYERITKGEECAQAAIKMIAFKRQVQEL